MEQVDQKDLWSDNDGLQYSELCNALYERELRAIAQSSIDDIEFLKSRLNSLPYYVKRTSEHMLFTESPLQIDTQNGTWQYRQATASPLAKSDPVALNTWLDEHASLGIVLPVWQEAMAEQTVMLDSIDRIDVAKKRIRLNEHGWFSFLGQSEESATGVKKVVIKPSKPIMAAGCCGHRWNIKGRVSPRTLSLRELLLSTVINWPNFSRHQSLKSKI